MYKLGVTLLECVWSSFVYRVTLGVRLVAIDAIESMIEALDRVSIQTFSLDLVRERKVTHCNTP